MARRTLDAFIVAFAFAALFVGRVVMYPIAIAPGGLLDRVRAEQRAWSLSHLILLFGILALIPAVLILARELRDRSRWLCRAFSLLLITGAALTVGQYALDFAVLAAAQMPAPSGQLFFDTLRQDPIVNLAFYKLIDLAGIGMIALAIAMWRQAGAWRIAALLIVATIALSLVQSRLGPIGPRITLGIQMLAGFVAAYKVLRPTETINSQ
ncbi:MAG: hypothetical protein KF805_12950 [Phycisphaeraceae bacterium]|nr:hypothetical protein [Phycisphaeraceae bacterium]